MTTRYLGPTVRSMNELSATDSDLAVAILMLVLFLIALGLILPRLTGSARSR